MRQCIYCRQFKDSTEFTLEHVIPQFLGGAYAPDRFKTRDVCERCNNNLGLFVDAGFEKDWFVTQSLREIAYRTFDPDSDVGLPLICMGQAHLPVPGMGANEICESWLGPLGEQVYWVRMNDERLYWYAGGNPRTAKETRTRAYFMFSERSHKAPFLPIRAFRDAFSDRKVKKIVCTKVEGIDPGVMGFAEPDYIDQQRMRFFLDYCTVKQVRNNRLSMYVKFDVRFISKLAIGVAYCLFGEQALCTAYAEELYKGLNLRPDEDVPGIHGVRNLNREPDTHFDGLMGDASSVTIAILPVPDGVGINLNIGGSMNWLIKCASSENLKSEDVAAMGEGRVIVLLCQLQRGVECTMSEYIAHKLGNLRHPGLGEISSNANNSQDYLASL